MKFFYLFLQRNEQTKSTIIQNDKSKEIVKNDATVMTPKIGINTSTVTLALSFL